MHAWLLSSKSSINPISSSFVVLILARLGQERSGLSTRTPSFHFQTFSTLFSVPERPRKMNMWLEGKDYLTIKLCAYLSFLTMHLAIDPLLCPP